MGGAGLLISRANMDAIDWETTLQLQRKGANHSRLARIPSDWRMRLVFSNATGREILIGTKKNQKLSLYQDDGALGSMYSKHNIFPQGCPSTLHGIKDASS